MKTPFTPRVKPASAGFIAEIVEIPEITATGTTPDEARKNVMKALDRFAKEQPKGEVVAGTIKAVFPKRKPDTKRKNARPE